MVHHSVTDRVAAEALRAAHYYHHYKFAAGALISYDVPGCAPGVYYTDAEAQQMPLLVVHASLAVRESIAGIYETRDDASEPVFTRSDVDLVEKYHVPLYVDFNGEIRVLRPDRLQVTEKAGDDGFFVAGFFGDPL